jgi:hypothetical protein
MSDLKYLEIQRLVRELQFLESDYKYQLEVVKLHEGSFMQSISNVVDKFPDLKPFLESKKRLNISQDLPTDQIEESLKEINHDQKIKNVYRSIVKITHPDKVNNQKLNDLYLEATNSYESGDFLSLYKVSIDLKIDFDWGDEEVTRIRQKIDEYRNQISLLRSSYTYQCILSNNKNDVILDYIKSNLNYTNSNASIV